jgi:hypothetical protein
MMCSSVHVWAGEAGKPIKIKATKKRGRRAFCLIDHDPGAAAQPSFSATLFSPRIQQNIPLLVGSIFAIAQIRGRKMTILSFTIVCQIRGADHSTGK